MASPFDQSSHFEDILIKTTHTDTNTRAWQAAAAKAVHKFDQVGK